MRGKYIISLLIIGITMFGLSQTVIGDGRGVNYPYSDCRFKIGADSILVGGTASDTLTMIPVDLYATGLDSNGAPISGLRTTGLELYIDIDDSDLNYWGFELESHAWEGSTWDSLECPGGDCRVHIICDNGQHDFTEGEYDRFLYLKFSVDCINSDSVQYDITPLSYSEITIVGDDRDNSFDSLYTGSLFIYPYWIIVDIPDTTWFVIQDTAEITVTKDNSNFRFASLRNYIVYDTIQYTFAYVEETSYTPGWSFSSTTSYDTISVIGYGPTVNQGPTNWPLYNLVFVSNVTSDSTFSSISIIDHESSYFSPLNCALLRYEPYITYDTGIMAVDTFEFNVKLDYPDYVTLEDDSVGVAILVKSNFPAGNMFADSNMVVMAFEYDTDEITITSFTSVYDTVTFTGAWASGKTPAGYAEIEMASPDSAGQEGWYIHPSETFDTIGVFYFQLNDSSYGCPDVFTDLFTLDFYANYGTFSRAVDTSGNVICGNVPSDTGGNGKMVFIDDSLLVYGSCAEVYAEDVSGAPYDNCYTRQPIYLSNYLPIDSIYVALVYDTTKYCISVDSLLPNLNSDFSADTVKIFGSSLNLSIAQDRWIAEILLGNDNAGVDTTDVNNCQLITTDSEAISNIDEYDGVVTFGASACYPCSYYGDDWENQYEKIDPSILPRQFALHQNIPNPFNPATRIEFDIPTACDVRLEIFNILGQRVESLVDDYLDAGHYSVIWNTTGKSRIASGIYFYRIEAGVHRDSKKMLLIK